MRRLSALSESVQRGVRRAASLAESRGSPVGVRQSRTRHDLDSVVVTVAEQTAAQSDVRQGYAAASVANVAEVLATLPKVLPYKPPSSVVVPDGPSQAKFIEGRRELAASSRQDLREEYLATAVPLKDSPTRARFIARGKRQAARDAGHAARTSGMRDSALGRRLATMLADLNNSQEAPVVVHPAEEASAPAAEERLARARAANRRRPSFADFRRSVLEMTYSSGDLTFRV